MAASHPMAIITTTTTTSSFTSSAFSSSHSPSLTPNPRAAKRAPRCAMHHQLPPQEWRESRRLVNISLSLLLFPSLPPHAIAGNGFDKYVKRKQLEPLETYVPAVILTEFQIKDIEKSLEDEQQPQYASYRTILRSGPAASFRSNVRAVAQYASDDGKGKTASDDVDRCLRALDELDSLFLRASRNNPAASAKLMKEKIGVAVSALESLLQTVPSDVLDKGKAIAEAYRTPEDNVAPEELDQDLKELQSIL